MCIITTHAIFISSTIKYNIMNTDSKLKRYIVLLDKAPFVLFLESTDYLPNADCFVPPLKPFNLSLTDVLRIFPIKPEQDIRKIISATNGLSDQLAYDIIDALANSIGYSQGVYFHVEPCFKSAKWQEHVVWQNVDAKPEPAPVNHFTITIDRLTHELSIICDADTVLEEKVYEGVIHIESLDTKVPFPQALLKECTMEVYDIIVQTSVSRAVSDKTKSKYLLVMQTGQETFNYINLRQIEKDLTATIKKANFTIEE